MTDPTRPYMPGPDRSAEELNRLAEQGFVFDHEYIGNICGGMGGKTECKKFTTTGRCRRSPFFHYYIRPKHSEGAIAVDCERTPENYVGRHLIPEPA